MTYKFYPFLVSLTLIPSLAIAQNDTDINADIIVTASKIAQTADKVGSSVTVLDRKTLLKRGDRSVADSLARVPGVSFSRNGSVGSTTNIRIRGVHQSQVLVLIDGFRVSDAASVNRAFDFSTLLATDIERIEILRGNQSSLYGSDAIGGVINITTFKPEIGTSGTAFLEGGSFGTIHGGASVRGGNDKITYGLSANHFHNNGFSRRDTGTETDGNDITALRGNIGLNFTENLSLTFNGGYEFANFEYDSGFGTSQLSHGNKELIYGGATLTHFAFNDALKSQLFYRASQTDRHGNSGTGFINNFQGTNQTIGYQGDINFLERDILTFGTDYDIEMSESSSNNTAFKNQNHAYFINYVKGIGDNLTLTLGGRLDNHQQFGTQETYRSTLAYNIPVTNSKIHASYGTGFKAPSLFQLFSNGSGNATLNPEKSRGFDVGLTQNFLGDKIQADVTYFQTKIENVVFYDSALVNCPTGALFGCYNNFDQANIQGIEFDLTASITDTLNVFGNYTFTDAEDDTTNLTLPRRPKHLFNVGTDFQIKDVSVTLLGKYVGDQIDSGTTPNDAFFTADAQASYDLTDKVALYGRVENIFDADYQETLTYNTAGVSAYGGIRLRY